MQKLISTQDIVQTQQAWAQPGLRVGFVPTMGYLHEGHLSLIDLAKSECDIVIASIFVNPKQFAPNEDLNKYPRDEEKDLELLRQRGTDYTWLPTEEDIYPDDYSTYVNESYLSEGLCGKSRTGHFQGVCTILTIFCNILRPTHLYLGEKDAQQLAVVKRMVKDLHLPLTVRSGPLIREADGLAMSSRNVHLNAEQRKQAIYLNRGLDAAQQLVQEGKQDVSRIIGEINFTLSKCREIRIIYIEVVHKESLQPLKSILPGQTLVAIAVWVGQVRLIDNRLL